jgi:hypothetical protein
MIIYLIGFSHAAPVAMPTSKRAYVSSGALRNCQSTKI